MELLPLANKIFSFLTVASQAAIFLIIAAAVFHEKRILDFVKNNAVLLSFVVALTVTLGSLFYSEIIGYEPCKLCWLQRIFIYPQVILLGIALWKKDHNIAPYAITLSIIGGLIASYHYLLQIGLVPSVFCAATSSVAECASRFVMSFGYVTLGMMSLTAFALIILFMALKLLLGSTEQKPE